MKKVLVPCDFSKPAMEAFKSAVELTTKTGGSIILLHVIYIPPVTDSNFDGGVGYSPELISLWQEDAETSAQSIIDELPPGSPPVTSRVIIGSILEVILSTIKNEEIDLVVMGKTGRSGASHFIVGSNTEKVVRYSPVPVLAVTQSSSIKSVSNIVLPSTLALNQTHFMEKVKQLQEFFHATIHVLHVNTPRHFQRDSDAKAGMQEVIRNYHLTNCKTHFVNNYSEEAGITEFAADHKMDLIVMGTHSRKGLSHLLNRSISEDVADGYPGAVWTYSLKA